MGWLRALLENAGLLANAGTAPVSEKIDISRLEEWLEARLRECVAQHALDAAMLEYLSQLKEKRWEIEEKLEEWDKKIQALGIPAQSKDIGPLFAETRAFLEMPSLLEKNSIPSILHMNRELEGQLQQLQAKLQQSSFAYNYSFLLERGARAERDQQLNPLLQALLDIDSMRKRIEDKVAVSGYKSFYLLCTQAKALPKTYGEMQLSAKEFEQRNQKLLAVEQKHDEKDAELQVLQQHHLYQDIRELRHRRQELLNSLRDNEEQLEDFFLSLKPALEQYQMLVPDNSIVPRLVKAGQARVLYEDPSGVNQVLKAVQRMLTAEKLSLPPEKTNLILAELDRGMKSFLPEMEKEYHACSSEMERLQEDKDFVQKLEEAQYRLDHFRQQVQRLRREVKVLDEEQSAQKAELERQVKVLKEQIKNIVGREIEVVA